VKGPLDPPAVSALAQFACLLEVSTPKPGNVSYGRDFEDTRYEDFLLSAAAIGPALSGAGERRVGETILAAIRDTRRFVPQNTNLGIVLLLAPLARAASRGGPIREGLSEILRSLTRDDARDAYEAIRLARPGGLGQVSGEDVRGDPSVTLREAMALARERDSIAREYVTDYDLTFGLALPALRRARSADLGWHAATLETYLHVLASVPDTLIVRKEGLAAARAVSDRAREVVLRGEAGSPEREEAVLGLDRELRGQKRNPGTTADLMVAALFVALYQDL
jgi:triphosphoribosyl-dephospho-CoA synthase